MSAAGMPMSDMDRAYELILETCDRYGYQYTAGVDDGSPDLTLFLPQAPGRRGVVRYIYTLRDGQRLSADQRTWYAIIFEAGARVEPVYLPSTLQSFVDQLADEATIR